MSKHEHHHHTHNHTHVHTGQKLLAATILNLCITAVEIAGGILSNSVALLSDALHNFGDAIAVFLAYISNRISRKAPTTSKTFGFKRVEIFAALFNGVAMVAICVYLFIEAFKRFGNPQPINGILMMGVATIGLVANLAAVLLLKHDKDHNLNVKAAYLHLLGDTLSSVAVIIGGICIYFFQLWWLDPLITIAIGMYMLKETWHIIVQAYNIMLQSVPENLDLDALKNRIETMPEIENVHHAHAWQLNDEQIHFECHIDLKNDCKISETNTLLDNLKHILTDEFKITHTTIQFEFNCCDNKALVV